MTTFNGRHGQYTSWWKRKREGRVIWVASAPVPNNASPLFKAPNCEKVDHLFSAVFEPGVRHYAFDSEEARDRFVSDYHEAQACEDPIP